MKNDITLNGLLTNLPAAIKSVLSYSNGDNYKCIGLDVPKGFLHIRLLKRIPSNNFKTHYSMTLLYQKEERLQQVMQDLTDHTHPDFIDVEYKSMVILEPSEGPGGHKLLRQPNDRCLCIHLSNDNIVQIFFRKE